MNELEDLKASLAADETRLRLNAFSNADALTLGLSLLRLAGETGKPVAVAIERNRELLFAHSMDGCCADHAEWLRRKMRVVRRYGHGSWYMGVAYRARGTTFEAHTGLDPARYAAKGGAFPILLAGTGMVGVVAVSGLSEGDDHALVVRALDELLRRQARQWEAE